MVSVTATVTRVGPPAGAPAPVALGAWGAGALAAAAPGSAARGAGGALGWQAPSSIAATKSGLATRMCEVIVALLWSPERFRLPARAAAWLRPRRRRVFHGALTHAG